MTDAPPDDLPKNELEFVRQWLEAIELSEDEEKDWRDTADRACDTYRGGMPKNSTSNDVNLNTFNIFHANVETLVPSLYNSTPIPDVRRRFNDDDPIGKEVSEIFERGLSYSVDAYDFDQTMLSSVRDMAITSRGIVRVRYEPSISEDKSEVVYEQVTCEYVPWRTFRRGPGRTWREVPWQAFDQFLSYDEVERLLSDEKDKAKILKEMKFSYSAEPKKQAEQQGENLSKLAARARVWEIWDKDNRKVHFISPDYTSRRLTSVDDPLELEDFFPTPRPLAAIIAPDSLVPITLLQVYERLLEELNIVQRRIIRLTGQLRPRGGYAGIDDDIKQITEAGDGELVPLKSAEMFATVGGGLEKAIVWFPLDATTKALQQLVEQRELIKATIYEVTGLSDIIRGASDARETATAQQIKSQWGSLRIQRMQAEVARFARDLFRMKAEIIANKFSFDTIELMTGLKYPKEEEKQAAQQQMQMMQQSQQPQPGMQPGAQPAMPPPDPAMMKQIESILSKPSREEVEKMLRSDAVRGFRVDIESDSTIRGDAARTQEQQALFLQGTAQYLSAVGPMVQEGVMPAELAIEIYAGFARSFRLGKQAEDAIDRLADQAKAQANQPKQPSPEEIKAQAEKQKMEMEAKAQQDQHAMKLEEMKMGLEIKRQEMEMKRQELDMRREEMAMDMQIAQQKAAMDQEQMQNEAVMHQAESAMDMQAAAQKHQLGQQATQEKHELGMQTMKEKAAFQSKQLKAKPKAKAA
jgi:hypothetical protein